MYPLHWHKSHLNYYETNTNINPSHKKQIGCLTVVGPGRWGDRERGEGLGGCGVGEGVEVKHSSVSPATSHLHCPSQRGSLGQRHLHSLQRSRESRENHPMKNSAVCEPRGQVFLSEILWMGAICTASLLLCWIMVGWERVLIFEGVPHAIHTEYMWYE